MSFKVFVGSDTSIGYFDLSVECISAITKNSEITVSLYLNNQTDSHSEDEPESSKQGDLLCGPFCLSESTTGEPCKANLMLTSPRLITVKSSYFVLEFNYHSQKSTDVDVDEEHNVSSTNSLPAHKEAIADFIKNIQLVVHQFAPPVSTTTLPPSSRSYMLESSELQEKLLLHLITAVNGGLFVAEDSEARNCLELFVWIWNICSLEKKDVR